MLVSSDIPPRRIVRFCGSPPGAFHFKTVNTLYPVKNPFTKACFLSLNECLIELLTMEGLF